MGCFIRLSDSSESSIPIMRRSMVSRRGKAVSGKLARSVIGTFDPRLAVRRRKVQDAMDIRDPRIVTDVLERLHREKYLLKVGSVYYINPNQPSAVSSLYGSRAR